MRFLVSVSTKARQFEKNDKCSKICLIRRLPSVAQGN